MDIENSQRKLGPAGHVWTLKTVHDRCEEVGDCWIWQQACVNDRPQASIGGKGGQMVRRYAFCFAHSMDLAQIRGLVVTSACGENRCCNPEHLRLVTHGQVLKRSWATTRDRARAAARQRGVVLAGRAGGIKPKLTQEQVQEIRSDLRPSKELGPLYGVTASHISAVRRGASWGKPLPGSSVFAFAAARGRV